MNSKIEKHFQHSQFYRNYNNIDFVILKFTKIKKEYIDFKNKLVSILPHKNQFNNKILDQNICENDPINLFCNKIRLNRYQKILKSMLNIQII